MSMHFFVWRLTTTLNEHQLWDGWAGRFVSAHRPNVSNCLLLLFSFLVEARRGEKKGSLCVLFFLPSLKRIRETKQTQTHVRTHTDTHTRDPVIKKKIQFWAPTFRDQKRKEKAAQTTVAVAAAVFFFWPSLSTTTTTSSWRASLLIRHIKALILCFNELIKEFLAISAVWTTRRWSEDVCRRW